jgi:hypothetical protein
MLPSGVTIPATVPKRSEIPEGLTNYPVFVKKIYIIFKLENYIKTNK